MGLSFRKRVKLFPGFYVNVSKSGTSFSAGPRGAKVNVGKRGVTLHTSIPGTGVYYRETLIKRKPAKASTPPKKEPLPPFGAMCVLMVTLVIAFTIFINNFGHFWISLIVLLVGVPFGLWLAIRDI